MKRLSIYKNNVLTNQLSFESQETLEVGLAYHKSINSFGRNASTETVVISPGIPAVLDENGAEIYAGVAEVVDIVQVPADYTIVIEDIIDNSVQEKINADALKFLAETDYMIIREYETGIICPEEIKDQRQAARDRIIK